MHHRPLTSHLFAHLHFALLIFCILSSTDHFRLMSTVVALTASMICEKIPSLVLAQERMCRERPHLIVAIGDGLKMGKLECQKQFRYRRWNCTALGSEDVFTPVLVVGSREAAYAYAAVSAGVTYAITQSCSRGKLRNCGCDTSRDGMLDAEGGWKWGGCSADIRYGMRMSRQFLDAREIEGDERSLMNLHNNRAGRKAVLNTMRTECKCHGVSGSCTMKTCWNTLPAFTKTADYLMRRYQSAKRVFAFWGPSGNVITSTRKNRPLFLKTKKSKRPHRKPRARDLVYLETSPNYCEPNPAKGSPGTVGRVCNRDIKDKPESCALMCCGRGYNTHRYNRTVQCECKFSWCCSVTCRSCIQAIEKYTCK